MASWDLENLNSPRQQKVWVLEIPTSPVHPVLSHEYVLGLGQYEEDIWVLENPDPVPSILISPDQSRGVLSSAGLDWYWPMLLTLDWFGCRHDVSYLCY
jgi:hypothetical protein